MLQYLNGYSKEAEILLVTKGCQSFKSGWSMGIASDSKAKSSKSKKGPSKGPDILNVTNLTN